MRFALRDLSLAGAALALLPLLAPSALALPFSASCDRFDIDGNAFGPADGGLDFVDEFDAGALSPNWTLLLGSAGETGGALVAHDPGTLLQLGPTPFEISTVENAVHEITNGAGSFTMRSVWLPVLPAVDTEFHMQLYSLGPIIEAAGITVNDLSPQIATQQGNGSLAGYSVSQSLTHGFGAGFTTVAFDTVSIAPAAVTGPIVLRMALDDATDMLTCSFSLDGGATFQSPFAPMHVFNGGVADYDVLLGAAALSSNVVSIPAQTMPLQLLVVKSGVTPASRRVTYKASFPPHQGLLYGAPTSTGATFKLALDGQSQCFALPSSGWTRNGPVYKYADATGAHGAVRAAFLKQAGNGAIQTKVVAVGSHGPIDIVPPDPGVQADANFTVPAGGSYCASSAGGSIGPNDARTFKVKQAPAPASCAVSACSPSGAFLDPLE